MNPLYDSSQYSLLYFTKLRQELEMYIYSTLMPFSYIIFPVFFICMCGKKRLHRLHTDQEDSNDTSWFLVTPQIQWSGSRSLCADAQSATEFKNVIFYVEKFYVQQSIQVSRIIPCFEVLNKRMYRSKGDLKKKKSPLLR